MGYINDNLLPGERIVYAAKLHWIIFLWPSLFIVFGVMALANTDPESAKLAMSCFIVGGVWGGLRFIRLSTSEFAVTNQRVMIKVGFIRRRTLEMQLPKVETVGVKQGVFGRLLDYGTIVVVGAGGTREPFSGIAAPLRFREAVFQEIGRS